MNLLLTCSIQTNPVPSVFQLQQQTLGSTSSTRLLPRACLSSSPPNSAKSSSSSSTSSANPFLSPPQAAKSSHNFSADARGINAAIRHSPESTIERVRMLFTAPSLFITLNRLL
ncbi:hypothetical protein M6B38_377550 [Iris pallida]|uniref:Uncharacterized protein n=1 Tax=Iris pallida TaxID=29817 RepID=A0AAX6GBL6_IRIPA|nr:hypothetical protein M6B38_377550 [Iris pallida]